MGGEANVSLQETAGWHVAQISVDSNDLYSFIYGLSSSQDINLFSYYLPTFIVAIAGLFGHFVMLLQFRLVASRGR